MKLAYIESVEDFQEFYRNLQADEQNLINAGIMENQSLQNIVRPDTLLSIFEAEGIIYPDDPLRNSLIESLVESEHLKFYNIWEVVLVIATKRKDVELYAKIVDIFEDNAMIAEPHTLLSLLYNKAFNIVKATLEPQGFNDKLFTLAEESFSNSISENWDFHWGEVTYQTGDDDDGFWIPSSC